MTRMLTDSNAAETIAKLRAADAKLADKIASFIRDAVAKIKAALSGTKAKGYSEITKSLDRWQELADLFAEGVAGAMSAYENGVKATSDNKNSIRSDFAEKFDSWFENTTSESRIKDGGKFLVGTTSDILMKLGAKDYNIYFGKSKIQKILNEHKDVTPEIIKQAVYLIENPIIVMQSKTVDNSIVLLGEVYTKAQKPVIVSLLLNPKNKNGEILDYAVITSAYSRRTNNIQNLINTSTINYVSEDKKRTDKWLSALGLQLPSAITSYGSVNSISYTSEKVNNKFSDKDSEYLELAKNPEKNEARLREMVDEAAKAAMPNTKVIDDNGNPKVVYHGRTSEFNVFDRSYANIEGDFGKGYYFSSDYYDSANNYGEEGADITNKIAKEAERIEADSDGEISYEEAKERAREKYITAEANVLDCFIDIENPVMISDDNRGTFLDFNEEYDEEYDEYGEPEGLLVDFIEALQNQSREYAWSDVDFSFLYENAYEGGLYAYDAVKAIKENIIDELMDENGDLAINEVIRAAFEEIGFDGIIDSWVSYKFSGMGLNRATTHYIAFDSSQIKSADLVTYDDNGNVIPLSERFNLGNEDIRYSEKTLSDGTKYVRLDGNIFVDENGNELSPRQAYQRIAGTILELPDGDKIALVKRIAKKDMYDELFKRWAKYDGDIDIRKINTEINKNIIDVLVNSETLDRNVADKDNRHTANDIQDFDTRYVLIADDNGAYNLTLSIANLTDGTKIGYAKKRISPNSVMWQKIKAEEGMGEKSQFNQPLYVNATTQSEESQALFSRKGSPIDITAETEYSEILKKLKDTQLVSGKSFKEYAKAKEKSLRHAEYARDKLVKENEQLAEMVRLQRKQTKGKVITPSSINTVAKRIYKEAGARGNVVRIKNRNIITGERPAPIAVSYGNDVSTKNATTQSEESQALFSRKGSPIDTKRYPDSALITNLL